MPNNNPKNKKQSVNNNPEKETNWFFSKEAERLAIKAKREVQQMNIKKSVWGTNSTTHAFPGLDYDTYKNGLYKKAAKKGAFSLLSPPRDIVKEAWKNQTVGDIAADVVLGGAKLTVAGFLDSIGSWDIADMNDLVVNKEFNRQGNWFQQAAQSLKDSANEENMIYQNGEHNLMTGAYWANLLQQQGYSIGIGLEAIGEQALLSFLGPEANVAGLSTKARLLKNLGNVGKQLVLGISSGIKESYVNARDTAGETYQKLINSGYNEQEALKRAGEAASTAFKAEVGPMLAINTLQNVLLFNRVVRGNKAFHAQNSAGLKFGYSDAVESALEKLIPTHKINNKIARGAIEYGLLGPISESAEEVLQGVASEYGQYTALKGTKLEEKFNPFNLDRVDDALGGFMGGLLLGSAKEYLINRKVRQANKAFDKEYSKFMQSNINKNEDLILAMKKHEEKTNELRKIVERNPTPENIKRLKQSEQVSKYLQKTSNIQNVIQALQFDYYKGEGTKAFDMYLTNLEKQLEAVNNGDIDTLIQHGLLNQKGEEVLPGAIDLIKSNFTDYINDAKTVKTLLENNLNNVTSDLNIASKITEKEFVLDTIVNNENTLQKEFEEIKSKDKVYNSLNNKELHDKIIKINALQLQEKLSDSQKEELKTLENEVKEELGLNDNKQINEVESTKYFNKYIELQAQLYHLNNLKEDAIKEVTKVKSEEFIKSELEKRKEAEKKKVKKVKTRKEAEEIKENTDDEEIKKEAEKKEKELKAKEAKENLVNPVEDDETNNYTNTITPETNNEEKISEVDILPILDEGLSAFGEPVIPNNEEVNQTLSNNTSSDNKEEHHSIDEPQALFDPSKIDIEGFYNKFSDYLKQKLGRDIDFKDIADFVQEGKGTDYQKKRFIEELEKVHLSKDINQYINERDNLLSQFDNETENTTSNVVNNAKEEAEKIQKKNAPITGVNENGEATRTVTRGLKKATGEITIGVLSKPYVYVDIYDENGNFSHKEKQDAPDTDLNDSPYINSKAHLDPDKLNPGSRVVVEIPKGDDVHYDNILVYNYDKNGNLDENNKRIPFKQWVALHNIEPGSKEWYDKVPMVIYELDENGNKISNKGVGFIHDTDWYNKENITDFEGDSIKQEEVIKNGKETHSILRENVAKNGSVILQVSEKRPGTFTNYSYDNLPTLAENKFHAQDDIEFAFVTEGNNVVFPERNSNEQLPSIENHSVNDNGFSYFSNLKVGKSYEVRRSTNKNSVMLFETLNPPIRENEKVITTVVQAVRAFMTNDEKTLKNLGISNGRDLESYIQNFIHLKHAQLTDNNNNLTQSARDLFNTHTYINNQGQEETILVDRPVMFFSGNGERLIFGRGSGTVNKNITYKSINRNKENLEQLLQEFEQFLQSGKEYNYNQTEQNKNGKSFQTTIPQNVNLDSIKTNKEIVFVDKNGDVVEKQNYKTFLTNTLKTPVKSYNIGTQENPKYATIIQPTINFKIAEEQYKPQEVQEQSEKKLIEENTKKVEEAKKEVVNEKNTKTLTKEEYEKKKADIEKRRVKDIEENEHGIRVKRETFTLEDGQDNATKNVVVTHYKDNSKIVVIYNKEGDEIGREWIKKDDKRNYVHQYNLADEKGKDLKFSVEEETLTSGKLDKINKKYDTELAELEKQYKASDTKQQAVQKTIEENKQKLINEKIDTYKLALQSYEYELASILKQEIEELTGQELNTEELDINDDLFDPSTTQNNSLFNNQQIENIIKDNSELPGISIKEQFQLVKYLYNQYAIETFNSDKVDSSKVKNDFLENLNKQIENKEKLIENLKNQNDDNKFDNFINEKLEELKTANNIKENIDLLDKKAKQELAKYTKVQEIDSQIDSESIEDNNETDKNHSKSSLEENGKKQGSYLLKRFYAGIPAKDKQGRLIRGIMGIKTYVGFDTIDDTIKSILTSPSETEANFETMMAKLKEYTKLYTWLQDVINELESPNTSTQLRNTFVKENTRHNLSMIFIMYSKNNKTGNYTLKTYDTNANDIQKVIRRQWENNILNNSLTYFDGNKNDYVINVNHIKNILKDLSKYTKVSYDENNITKTIKLISQSLPLVDNKILLNFLKEFGIEISSETLNELRNGIWINGKHGNQRIPFNNMFNVKKDTNGIFGYLLWKMNDYIQQNNDKIVMGETNENHPLKDANNILNKLSRIESKYSVQTSVTSFRDGGKSIYAKPLGKFATDSTNKFKSEDNTWRNGFLEKPFNKPSLIINALQENGKFREIFKLHHIGITAFKELGKNVFGDNSVTSLPDIDHELLKIGLLQDKETKNIVHNDIKSGFSDFRIGKLFFPTMADKSQMLALETILLNIKKTHFNDNITRPNEQILDLLYSQIAEPELNRIFHFLSSGAKTDNKKYDAMARRFVMLPSLNDIIVNINGEQHNLISLLTDDIGSENYSDTIKQIMNNEELLSQIKYAAKEKIVEYLNSEVDKKVKQWKDNYVGKDDNGKEIIKFLDSKYLNDIPGTIDEKLRVAAFDYVINYFNGQANMHMMYTGDLADYNNLSESVIQSKLNNGQTIQEIIKSTLDINAGKRYALLIAPRAKINNSNNETYLQVFLNDYVNISENIKELSTLLDGKELSDNDIDILKTQLKLENDEIVTTNKLQELTKLKTDNRNELIDSLNKKVKEIRNNFPNSSDYFSLEGSDAQEYTTANEHLHVLFQEGYLTDELYEDAVTKVQQQKEYLEKNGIDYVRKNGFPDEMMIGSANLKRILQPIKPVHTGFYNDTENNRMRMMYIKSSSFPLIPQVTLGFEIDNLRQKLEELENKQPTKTITLKGGKEITIPARNVRASYKTANKVGATDRALNIFNSDNTFNSNLTAQDFENASMELNRDNFGIQQDVPPKFTKDGVTKVSLGTQILKLLFGDGVMNIDGFDFNSEVYDEKELEELFGKGNVDLSKGKNLHKLFNKIWVDYINEKQTTLLNDFGLNPNLTSSDIKKTAKKIEELIKEEAINRGYPLQDIQAAEIVINENEKLEDGSYPLSALDFVIPLWASPNSNRYESLLNSIISKRLINVKLPGNSYVVGSEAGFKLDKRFGGIDKSKIVFTSAYDFNEGKLKAWKPGEKAQVFVPSRFKDNKGNIIKLINDDGTHNETYVEKTENGLKLKEDSIDKELLNMTSFRIPTSGHVSTVQVEIAGFLPHEVGDLMIVPANLTVQKGLDFDIDKETTYQLHTYTDPKTGAIRVFNKVSKEKLISKVRKEVEQLRDAKEISKLFDGYGIGEELTEIFSSEEYNSEEKLKKLESKLNEKLYENEIVKMHSAVLSNQNPEMQKKINRVLSMNFAKSQAELVQNIISQNQDLTNWSPLSDSHQKYKMELGAVGKLGIGVYSNYVTFHSLLQQSDENISITDSEGKPVNFTIGNLSSDGVLGKIQTLGKGIRTIAEVFAERQNTATDNEKEQIMGRLNINDVTINVDSLLSLLGFDIDVLEDGTKVSIPYLLLSQPIIKEYVKRVKESQSQTKQFNKNSKQEIINDLLGIDPTYKEEMYNNLNHLKDNRKELTGENLLKELKSDNINSDFQKTVLHLFDELNKYATEIGNIQRRLNINKDGLGKSFFDTIDKYEFLQNPKSENINNVESLIGKVERIFIDESFKEEDVNKLKNDFESKGYTTIDEYNSDGYRFVTAIKPETPTGIMMVRGITTGYNMWKSFFPYNSTLTKSIIDGIINDITDSNTSNTKKIELRQKVFQDFKKYLFTSSHLGILKNNLQEERYRLAIDNKEKQSLASYLQDILNDSKYTFLKNNPLLSSFTFDGINNHGYSILKFNNSKQEDFDEEYMYQSIIELLEKPIILKDFNGEKYTTRNLAEDLIKYAYLEGGIQEAIQYVKYIPISVLKHLNFAKSMRLTSQRLNTVKDIDSNIVLSRFKEQYAQHNPQYLKKIEIDSTKFINDLENKTSSYVLADKKNPNSLLSFTLNDDTITNKYVSIYNPNTKKGQNKFMIFKRVDNTYNRINTLGTFGMSEYQIGIPEAKSNINDNFTSTNEQELPKNKQNISVVKKEVQNKESNKDFFGIKEGKDLNDILNNINNTEFKKYGNIKEITKLLVENDLVPNDINIKVIDLGPDKNGSYDTKTKTITINERLFDKGHEQVAKTLVKELTHRLTYHEMQKYINADGTRKQTNEKVPAYVDSIISLFNNYRDYLIKNEKVSDEEINNVNIAVKGNNDRTGKRPLSPREKELIYPATNIFEFVEVFFTENELQKKMDSIEYKQSKKSFFDKFKEFVAKVFNNLTKGNVSAETISTILEIIETDNGNNNLSNSQKLTNKVDEILNKTKSKPINTGFGTVITPTDTDLQNTFSKENNIKLGSTRTVDLNGVNVSVEESNNITNAEGKKGAAQYKRKENKIVLDTNLLKQKFEEKAWTKPRKLIETIDGQRVESRVQALPENQFKTYEEFEKFVVAHEYQHSLYSRQDFNKEFPNKKKGDYETEINNRALKQLSNKNSVSSPFGEAISPSKSDLQNNIKELSNNPEKDVKDNPDMLLDPTENSNFDGPEGLPKIRIPEVEC